MTDISDFENRLTGILNATSMENGSNTPDFILAQYLTRCLEAWNAASRARENWYDRSLRIGSNDSRDSGDDPSYSELQSLDNNELDNICHC